MPPPRMTTLVPLPEPAGCSTVAAADAVMGSKPRDCIMVKAALYPPACPTLVRKSRLVNPISSPLSTSPIFDRDSGHVNGVVLSSPLFEEMVE